MNIYLLTAKENVGYDSYDSHVICAESEEEARSMFGRSYNDFVVDRINCGDECRNSNYDRKSCGKHNCVWSDPNKTDCKLIGTALENVGIGLILSSFNAG